MNTYRICLRLSKSKDSNTHRPEFIFDPLPTHRNRSQETARGRGRGKITNDWRFGPISVEWLDIEMSSHVEKMLASDTTSQTQKSVHGPAVAKFIETRTASGTTELPEGIIHIYRHNTYRTSPGASHTQASTSVISTPTPTTVAAEHSDDGTILAVLAVPSHMTASDFLSFVAPAAESMAHLRIIRDSSPNRSVVVIKFRTADDAREFAQEYNGRPFTAIQPEICHIVGVSSIEIETNDAGSLAMSRMATTADSDLHELPTCPVCLERMDTSVTGLVTVPCSHTFHCMCLSKWGDSRCPVCRYSQRRLSSFPQSAGSSRSQSNESKLSVCFDCSSTTNLWICLICGNIGCGRYGRAHAYAHYELTTHLYSLELETQRVWDYAGDGYVHRLIQNKADGKLVELPSAATMVTNDGADSRLGPGPMDTLNAEKIEAIGLEYSLLLTSQLDSQRVYYEEQMTKLQKMLGSSRDKIGLLENDLEARKEERKDYEGRSRAEETQQAELKRGLGRTEKKVEKLAELTKQLERELKDERAVNEGLLKNTLQWREKAAASEQDKLRLEERMSDMEEQLQDLMANFEMRDKLSQISDAAGGTIQVSSKPMSQSRKGKR